LYAETVLTNCWFSNVGVHVSFYIERFIPKLGPCPSPCSLSLTVWKRVFRKGKILPLEKKIERIRINLSHLGLLSGLCQGSRTFPVLEPWHQTWHQSCFSI
jgi:hypothetical protein